MKNFISRSTLFVILFFGGMFVSHVKASHMMGTDMYYECLGGLNYRFTLVFYRDCAGISAPSSTVMHLSSSTCGVANINVNLTMISGPTEVSPLCPAQIGNSRCNSPSGTQPGVQKFIYQGVFTLPQRCSDWVFSWTDCCRNSAISNLQGPAGQSQYVYMTLNNLGTICNNSPQFTSLPVPYICDSVPYVYNHGGFDPDGDSLVYQWQNALGSAPPGGNLTYVAPYSSSNPFPGPEFLDPITGTMTVTPQTPGTAQFNAVVSLRILEYRNGVMIGSTMRDIQIVVINNCANQQPDQTPRGITNLIGAGALIDSNSVQVCPGQMVQFEIQASDPNFNNVTMITNLGQVIPAATFTTVGSSTVIGTFHWTPTLADTGFTSFTVTIQDDGCPILGAQVFSFDITVVKETNAGPNLGYCPASGPVTIQAGGGTTFTWTNLAGGAPTGLSCNNCPTPTFPFGFTPATPSQHTFIVQSNLPAICRNRDTITINVSPNFTLNAGRDTTICANGAVFLQGSGTPSASGGPITPSWSPAAFTTPANSFVTAAAPISTTQFVLTGTDSTGCVMRDTAVVTVSGAGLYVNAGLDRTICPPANTALSVSISRPCTAISDPCTGPRLTGTVARPDSSYPASGALSIFPSPFPGARAIKMQAVLLRTELNAAGLGGGGRIDTVWLNFSAAGTRLCKNLTVKMGCTGDAGFSFNGSGTYPYKTGMTTVANFPVLNPAAGWYALPFNISPYNWDGQNNLVVEFCTDSALTGTASPVLNHSTSPDTLILTNLATNPSAMTICNNVNGTVRNFRPDMRVSFCASNPSGITYQWLPATGLSATNVSSPTASPSSTTTYIVNVTNGVCVSGDAVTVTVNCVLPVEQLNFRGYKVKPGVQLDWETFRETNTDKFLIQRSTDGNTWAEIGMTDAKGFTNGETPYNFLDRNPVIGSNFYRLQQVDLDGKSVYSHTVEIVYSLESALSSVYPNPSTPSKGFVLSYFASEESQINVSLFDLSGKLVANKAYNLTAGTNNVDFPTLDHLPGIYILKVTSGTRSDVRKVILSE